MTSIHDYNKVYMQGYTAHRDGIARDKGPYEASGDWREFTWKQGWDRADAGKDPEQE